MTAPTVAAGASAVSPSALATGVAYTFSTTAGPDPNPGQTIASYAWNFGDGSAAVVHPVSNSLSDTATHTFSTAGARTVTVTCTDTAPLTSLAQTLAVTVTAPPVGTVSPVTVVINDPVVAASYPVSIGGSTVVRFTFTAKTTAAGATITAGNLTFNPGEVVSAAPVITDNGGGSFTAAVTYSAAATAGTRVVTPSVSATDSLGSTAAVGTFPAITLTTGTGLAVPPVITVSTPASPTASVYTSVTVPLTFTLTDAAGAPVTYRVDWGDGTAPATGTAAGSTATGLAVSLSHVFPDSFHGSATTTITASDSLTGNGPATPVVRTFNVTFNAYPTAVITSPQASATIPAVVAALNIPATDPDVVVLPNNGIVTFQGATTLPASGDSFLVYNWSFGSGAVPSTSNLASPGAVSFSTSAGAVQAFLVEFTVTDVFGRVSKNAPAGVGAKTYRRWVVVDNTDTQLFTMSYLYRQRSGVTGVDSYSYAQNSSHGFNSSVTIFQDGITNSYTVAGASGATTTIPVRSDVPFWVNIPPIAGDTGDGAAYQFRIPNLPGIDPDLELAGGPKTLLPGDGTAFAFKSAASPYNPQLQITTGTGFGTEALAAPQRRFKGNTDLFNNDCYATGSRVAEPNLRWLDRLSVATTDLTVNQLPVLISSFPDLVSAFSGVAGYQRIPEWFVFLKATEVVDFNTLGVTGSQIGSYHTATAPTDLGFVIDDKYNGSAQTSEHFAVSALQAFRAPASTTDPYDFDAMKANITVPGSTVSQDADRSPAAGLNPTPVDAAGLSFMSGLVNTSPSSAPLAGGLHTVSVPYDNNDDNWVPNRPNVYSAFTSRSTFGYAEYLWTKVWQRPLVLNRTNLSWADTGLGFASYPTAQTFAQECTATSATQTVNLPWFFYSNPSIPWPSAANVSPNGSAYDLNVTGGGTFDASSPVTEAGSTGTNHGVGRFFWTSFAPNYDASRGALVSRTWLADGVRKQIPTTFTGTATDATTAWGFMPPQDAKIDKRARNLDGTPIDNTLGGYRVRWFNPTKDASGLPVPPDFWAIQVVTAASSNLYLVSGDYPRATPAMPHVTQKMTDSLMTDARTFLPSGQATFQTGDLAGPGYCWFDVPPEVRPQAGSATVTVFALKSITKNNAVAGSRAINRAEWVEAVKTVTASISTKPDGVDVSFAHKIPFNYPWDIVVVNGPATAVAP